MKEYFTGIQHIGIPTSSLTATIEFYESLGFEAVHRIYPDPSSHSTANVAFLKLHSLVIEAYEQEKTAMTDGAIDHVAIDVHTIEELFTKAGQNGYKLLTGLEFLPFWEHGIKYFIIEGINKERIEFCEILKEPC